MEAAFGLDANSPGQQPAATSSTTGGLVTISWPFEAGRSYRVERSTDLINWSVAGTVTGGSWVDPDSSTVARRCYRIVALQSP